LIEWRSAPSSAKFNFGVSMQTSQQPGFSVPAVTEPPPGLVLLDDAELRQVSGGSGPNGGWTEMGPNGGWTAD
jgi:hypothetical protein